MTFQKPPNFRHLYTELPILQTDRLEFGDLLLIAEAVFGEPAERLAHAVDLPRAESALAAPFATFGAIDCFPDPAQRAAICCSRIIRNHPFPDGNKRVAYECMREMLERSEIPWPRPSEDAAEITTMIERLAARDLSERNFVSWVRARTKLESR